MEHLQSQEAHTKKVLITGANGIIGTALRAQIGDFSVTPVDVPEYDIRDYDILKKILPGHDAIVHLAWNTRIDNAGSGVIDPDNNRMFSNVYRAALDTGVPRVIMASSVHAHTFMMDQGQPPLSPDCPPEPNNPYGAHKLFMENLGRYYASQGLEVVCIRFGGVRRNDRPGGNEKEKPLWLSHRDLGSLITACIEGNMSEKFCVLWGMSRDALPFYDPANPFLWTPHDSI